MDRQKSVEDAFTALRQGVDVVQEEVTSLRDKLEERTVPSIIRAAAIIIYERVGSDEWGRRDNRAFADSCLAMWIIDGCPDWDAGESIGSRHIPIDEEE